MGIIAFVILGLLAGGSPRHVRQMGEMSDRVAEAAKDTASAALESGKHVAQDAADSATEQGQELVSSLQGARPGLARPCAQHGLEERARAWGPPRPTSGSCETQPPTMGLALGSPDGRGP